MFLILEESCFFKSCVRDKMIIKSGQREYYCFQKNAACGVVEF
jgi:hypothetical protein